MAISLLSQSALVAVVGYVVYRFATKRSDGRTLPPGPKPLPVLGNIQDFPPPGAVEFEHWLKHKDLYGGISSVTVMGMTMVIIHDKEAAHDLLEQQASKTSGRPEMVFANTLCGYENIVLCQGYNNRFRHCRKLLHRELGTKVSAAQFEDAQEVEVNRQLVRALKEPEKWLDHIHTTTAGTVLKMAYGYNIETGKPDRLVSLIEKVLAQFSLAAVPMAWPVDILPILRYMPENFPGVSFKKTAVKWRHDILSTGFTPFRFVQRQMDSHTYRQSYVSKLIQQFKPDDEKAELSREDQDAIVWTAASLYGAAADTTVITLTVFTACMIKNPEVQRKAQEEIDRVIGTDRLPTFEDREKLPYVSAIVKETLRYWPIAPMGFPHTADDDVEYKGIHIPKGAMILPAVWWFLHDPAVYADPAKFDPDRYLSPRNEPDPTTEGFGYGRRICPGRFFADSGLYLNIAQSLATFSMAKAAGPDGKEIDVDVKPKPGILSYPSEFKFKITPRSAQHVSLIRQLEMKQPLESSDAELLGNEQE